jgi:hypothetical protein
MRKHVAFRICQLRYQQVDTENFHLRIYLRESTRYRNINQYGNAIS